MRDFEVRNNTIVSYGKFSGQPRWAPHFWGQAKQGLADARERGAYIFDITKNDIEKFPELIHYDIVKLFEDKEGYVSAEAIYE